MPDKIGSVKYNVVDWEKAYRFWTETIGLHVVWSDAQAGWGEFGPEEGCHIGINRWTKPEAIPHTEAAPVANFYVGDAFKTTEELRAKGVRCDDVRVVPGMVALGRFYDPEGNLFDMVSQAKE
ncbi:MAG: VOC family protein [Chloroflexi bacterium]|nr:VOC family protein [Chloroflexota bacterium]